MHGRSSVLNNEGFYITVLLFQQNGGKWMRLVKVAEDCFCESHFLYMTILWYTKSLHMGVLFISSWSALFGLWYFIVVICLCHLKCLNCDQIRFTVTWGRDSQEWRSWWVLQIIILFSYLSGTGSICLFVNYEKDGNKFCLNTDIEHLVLWSLC
jgi:hypothetical protein